MAFPTFKTELIATLAKGYSAFKKALGQPLSSYLKLIREEWPSAWYSKFIFLGS